MISLVSQVLISDHLHVGSPGVLVRILDQGSSSMLGIRQLSRGFTLLGSPTLGRNSCSLLPSFRWLFSEDQFMIQTENLM